LVIESIDPIADYVAKWGLLSLVTWGLSLMWSALGRDETGDNYSQPMTESENIKYEYI